MTKDKVCGVIISGEVMAKHNAKYSKTGMYILGYETTKVIVDGIKRVWCSNCKLFFKEKDYDKDIGCCKDCRRGVIDFHRDYDGPFMPDKIREVIEKEMKNK